MKREKFDLDYWAPLEPGEEERYAASSPLTPAAGGLAAPAAYSDSAKIAGDVERVVKAVEEARVDIAPSYAEWRDLGFALASEFGMDGMDYYQRLSQFNPNYTEQEAAKQYVACCNSRGSGITIRTLFGLAKKYGCPLTASPLTPAAGGLPAVGGERCAASIGDNGGVPLAAPAADFDEEEYETEVAMVKMPTIVGQVKEKLPPFLQRIVEMGYDDEEKDMLLLGSMTTMSACLPNVYGVYDSNELYPNLFMFLFAPPSSGKGRLTLCETLVSQIDRAMIEESARAKEDYDARAAQKASEGKLLAEKEPEKKMLLIPANASSTAVYQVLNNNGGVGLMFETEGDTLNNTLKTDYGNFSDGFRKAFHHERISYLRRKDSEHVSIEKPKLSVLLSGTPEQMHGLIRDTENGLFSRFMFYCMSIRNEWRNPFGGDRSMTLRERFYQLGTEFFRYYNRLKYKHPMEFVYSEEQTERFNAAFSDMQGECLDAFGADIVASVRRLAVITFRLSMVMTTLRHIDDEELPCILDCDERDFEAALLMAKTLLHHTARVYDTLPQAPTAESSLSADLERFYRALPMSFKRIEAVDKGKALGFSAHTSDRYLKRLKLDGRLRKITKGCYCKVAK